MRKKKTKKETVKKSKTPSSEETLKEPSQGSNENGYGGMDLSNFKKNLGCG